MGYIENIPCRDWYSEYPLVEWFKQHYRELGFDKIIHESDTVQYEELRKKLGFKYRPDFLVKRSDKWLRLEVEKFATEYKHHPLNHSDIVLCYRDSVYINVGIEVIALEDLGRLHEITAFGNLSIDSVDIIE